MVSGDDVLAFWARWFASAPGRLPSGPRVRLHSLPGSDQYPRCLADRLTILRRHNDVLTAALGDGRPYVLLAIAGDVFEDDDTDHHTPPPPPLDPSAFSVLVDVPVDDDDDDDDGPHIAVYWAPLVWSAGSMDAALLAVADETLTPPVFVSLERGVAVRPYPGGIDVFVRSSAEVAAMSTRFAAWLPGATGVIDLQRLIVHVHADEREALRVLLAAEADPYLDDDGAVSSLWLPPGALDDARLATIGTLRALTTLRCEAHDRRSPAARVTDAGLAHLHHVTTLRVLRLARLPAVTSTAIAALRLALPNCEIDIDE